MFDGNSFLFGVPIQAFTELGRTTLGSNGSTIQVSSLPNKKWLMVLCSISVNATDCDVRLRLGNGSLDTGTNYADRASTNGGADATSVTQAQIGDLYVSAANNFPRFLVFFIENASSSNEKLIQAWSVEQNTAGAGNVPNRIELVGKWTNTSNVIDTLAIVNLNAGSFATGSEVVVLGADPTDTSVTPFFKELGRGSGTGSAVNVDITLSSSKKYNLFTLQSTPPSAGSDLFLVVGNGSYDTGNNYAWRGSNNGSADTTQTTQPKTWLDGNKNITNGCFGFGFGINTATNEKLFLSWNNLWSATGAGNAPDRSEDVGKWANTSNQYDRVRFTTLSGGNLPTTSEFIWYGEN
jgi:hypothetical protein